MKCPHCKRDIREAEVLQASAAIIAKRRQKAGHTITSDQARELQARSAKARKANRERKGER